MKRIRDRVAGLDVHKDSVSAAVRLVEGGKVVGHKARFATTASGLAQLADWLAGHDVTTVGMEATGVYWRPVYYSLEGLLDEVWLCNAQHVKNVPGRKTDFNDAEWLADVVAHGMVKPSFVPPPPIRELRELTRYRKVTIDGRTREWQRLERLLQDAGIKLSSVASRLTLVSVRAMVEALIAGERDPEVLAGLAQGKLKAKIPQLQEALVASRFAAHHATLARTILDHVDYLDRAIATLSAEITERLSPFEGAVRLLCSIPGISRLTAEVIVAETGADMSAWPTAAHFAAWVGVAPASRESAGKRRPAGTRHGNTALCRAVIEAARAAARTKDTRLAARYRLIAARRGPNKALVALANTMMRIVHDLLTTGAVYHDLGGDYYDKRRHPEAQTRRLTAQLERLGYQVTLTPAA